MARLLPNGATSDSSATHESHNHPVTLIRKSNPNIKHSLRRTLPLASSTATAFESKLWISEDATLKSITGSRYKVGHGGKTLDLILKPGWHNELTF